MATTECICGWESTRGSPVSPVPGWEEVLVKPRLGRARFGFPVIAPRDEWRQRHQNGFGAAAALQAEDRAAIVDQVELHVASATIKLEIALALAEGRGLAPGHDGQVSGHERIADTAEKGKGGGETA